MRNIFLSFLYLRLKSDLGNAGEVSPGSMAFLGELVRTILDPLSKFVYFVSSPNPILFPSVFLLHFIAH